MITFDFRKNERNIEYNINWDIEIDNYSCLFLRYRNKSNIISVENRELKIMGTNVNEIKRIYPTKSVLRYNTIRLNPLFYAVYIFELFLDENCSGEPLKSTEILYSPDIQVYRNEVSISGNKNFSNFQISCRYKIPKDFIKLSLKGIDKEEFELPLEMIEKDGIFVTHCMIYKGYSDCLNVVYSPQIIDFINKGD